MLLTIRKPITEPVAMGESPTLEFKASMRWDHVAKPGEQGAPTRDCKDCRRLHELGGRHAAYWRD